MKEKWFKVFEGITFDPKWPLVSKKSGQPIHVVVSVWMALLEYGSNQEIRGNVAKFNAEMLDTRYGLADGVTETVIKALEEVGCITNGGLTNWDKRQPESESSTLSNAERQRLYRERHQQTSDQRQIMRQVFPFRNAAVTESNATVTGSNGQVTESNARNAAVTNSNATVTSSNGQVTESNGLSSAKFAVKRLRRWHMLLIQVTVVWVLFTRTARWTHCL